MSKGGGDQTVTQRIEPKDRAYLQQVYSKAARTAGQEYTGYEGDQVAELTPQYQQYLQQLTGLGGANSPLMQGYGYAGQQLGTGIDQMLGSAGREFGADSLSQYMDPYQQQVIDATRDQFDYQRGATLGAVGDAATRAKAFGGSRHGVAEGQALADLGRSENAQIGQMLQQGYGDAANRFMADRQFGLDAGQSLANLGFGGLDAYGSTVADSARAGLVGAETQRGINQQQIDAQMRQFLEQRGWGEHQLDILRSVAPGAGGGSTTTPLYTNPTAGALGGAAAGAAFGPVGAGVGAGIGLLGSLF